VPATSAAHNRLLFFLFLLRLFTVLLKQTRQVVHAIKQSIFLDVYGLTIKGLTDRRTGGQAGRRASGQGGGKWAGGGVNGQVGCSFRGAKLRLLQSCSLLLTPTYKY
jgi:hypothetical protein